jgi:4-hydroxybenzoate polyprenyltransferase
MVGARSFAMAVNRILDRKIDALNPRTATREIPTGKLSLAKAWAFATTSAFVYLAACLSLGNVVFALSPIPIALMTLYPFTKRFTALCHLILGASLGIAPVGAWVAVRGMTYSLGKPLGLYPYIDDLLGFSSGNHGLGWLALGELAPWLLGSAVMLWVAGFDVIYALQDDAFDREHKLHSIPAALGRAKALWVSRLMHAASAALFFALIYVLTHPTPLRNGMDVSQYTQLTPWVWAAPCVMLAGMIYQHSLVKPDDLSRVNVAFFTVNGIISVVFGAIFVAAWLLA